MNDNSSDENDLKAQATQTVIMFKNKYKPTIILCIVFVIIFGAYVIYTQITNLGRLVPIIEIETKVELDSRVLEASIKQIAELSTLVFHYSDVAMLDEQKTISVFGAEFGIIGTSKTATIVYDGEMKLGIDASKIEIDINNQTIRIALPEVKVLSHVVHEDSVVVRHEDTGLFTSISMGDYPMLIADRKREKEDNLIGSDLLRQSKENAQNSIKTLLSLFPGAEEYTIVFN